MAPNEQPGVGPGATDPSASVTAFVLGGGGKWGAVQVGMLAALVRADVQPDLVLGCSIGAINGAAFAAQPDADGVARLREVWQAITVDGTFSLRNRHPFRAPRGALDDATSLRRAVEKAVPVRRFEDLVVPFQCVAADIEAADEHWFCQGDLVDPIVASASVPGVFPPAEIDGHHFYDGGLVNSIPVDRAVAEGATRVFVLQVGRIEEPLRPPRRLYESALVALEIARRHRYSSALRQRPDHVEVHVLPTGNPVAFDDRRQLRMTDASDALDRLVRAEESADAYLEGLAG